MWKTLLVLCGVAAGLAGCGTGPTDAERSAIVGDVTSCYRNQLVEPPSCQAPPDVYCSRPIEECAAVGCRIDGSGTVLYPDWSWSDPTGATGDWSIQRLNGFDMVNLGNGAILRVDDSGAVIPGCS